MKSIVNFEEFWSEESRNVVVPVDLASELELVQEVAESQRYIIPENKGLWFSVRDKKWSRTIPRTGSFYIYYDGEWMGCQWPNFDLTILKGKRYIIKLKNKFCNQDRLYYIGRPLTLDDFEIVPNPDYPGDP